MLGSLGRTWFNGSALRHLTETSYVWNLLDPHASRELEAPVLQGWFADLLPDLNQDDPELRTYEIQNALWWVNEAGFDGIRQDTLPYVPRSFWFAWSKALKAQHPQLRVVGEVLDGNPVITSYFQAAASRTGLTPESMPFSIIRSTSALRDMFAHGKKLEELIQMMANDRLYADPAALVTILGDHDVSRFMSEKGATLGRFRLALTFLMTARGIPVIFYGDEIECKAERTPTTGATFQAAGPVMHRTLSLPPAALRRRQPPSTSRAN